MARIVCSGCGRRPHPGGAQQCVTSLIEDKRERDELLRRVIAEVRKGNGDDLASLLLADILALLGEDGT